MLLETSNFFVRTHRSYIANIHFAKRIIRKDGYLLVMDEQTQLPIINENVDLIIQMINQ